MDIARYFKSISAECEALKDRIRLLIHDAHWQTDGEWKETVLRTLIRRSLPSNITVGRGFVVNRERCSSQIDVLLYDNTLPPLYRDGDLAFITPSSCRGIIEVKTRVTPTQCRNAAVKLADNAQFVRQASVSGHPIFVGAFAFGEEQAAPERYLEALRDAAAGESSRIVDHLCLGSSTFAKYWPFEPVGLRQRWNHNRWHLYHLDGMAAGYFLHNLVTEVCSSATARREDVWFPPDSKEAYFQTDLQFTAA